MSVRNAHLYPGPGSYEPFYDISYDGPAVSFTRDRKKIRIEKNYAPGPATYQPLDTVGVIAEYNRRENYPKELYNAPQRMRPMSHR
jgi:hypothetical protein